MRAVSCVIMSPGAARGVIMKDALISIRNCSVRDAHRTLLERIDWEMRPGEAWLVTGRNGGGKEDFVRGVENRAMFHKNALDAVFEFGFEGSTTGVSFEDAASLIEEERARDESEYIGKLDEGRSAREYICEVIPREGREATRARLEALPEVRLCGVERVLDRGLKFLSTGEIRRVLLCRALLSRARLIVLSEPFSGLDAASREILFGFFETVARRQTGASANDGMPRIILCMERYEPEGGGNIPESINRVLEFTNRAVSFCGTREAYDARLKSERAAQEAARERERREFLTLLSSLQEEQGARKPPKIEDPNAPLVVFDNVNVGWGDNHVLVDLNWRVNRGEHWLIRGPNGAGKTTIMELITGDNMQVFREKVYLFGRRRGSGESIWDIKARLGIVSYRLHVEYRMVGGFDLESVIVSGFKDSIGLYERASDLERRTAGAWLRLGGFEGRGRTTFRELSYGEQRAILILRAAAKQPELLILDEPCHALDEEFRNRTLELLALIAGTGTTTLLHVTHDPTEVLDCEHHVLELFPGKRPMYCTRAR